MNERNLNEQNQVQNPQQPQQQGYPQQGYPQQPQQGYGYPQQQGYGYPQPQPMYQQPQQPATPGDINAVHSVTGSIMMLVLVIINSVVLVYHAVNGFISGGGLGIFTAIFGLVPEALMCAGLWLIWVNGHKRSNQITGFTLFKVGLVINFVFKMIIGLLTVIASFALIGIGGFVMPFGIYFILIGVCLIAEFVFEIIVFASLSGLMKEGKTIFKLSLHPRNAPTKTSGVALIVRSALSLAPNVILLIAVSSVEAKINEVLGKLPDFLKQIAQSFLGVGKASSAMIPGIVTGVIFLAVAIYYAIVIFKYVKEARAVR